MLALRVVRHVGAEDFVGSARTLLANGIIGLLHELVHTLVEVVMLGVHYELLAMIRVQRRAVVVFVGSALGRRQVRLAALIVRV